MVVEWFNRRMQLHIQLLEPWQQRIRQPQETFQELFTSHVHGEFNGNTDLLSKQALDLEEGLLVVSQSSGRVFCFKNTS